MTVYFEPTAEQLDAFRDIIEVRSTFTVQDILTMSDGGDIQYNQADNMERDNTLDIHIRGDDQPRITVTVEESDEDTYTHLVHLAVQANFDVELFFSLLNDNMTHI